MSSLEIMFLVAISIIILFLPRHLEGLEQSTLEDAETQTEKDMSEIKRKLDNMQ